jgi:outer membrane protein assembly factor BamB
MPKGSETLSLPGGDPDVGGGLIVHLGCGNGRATAKLSADDRYVVHGLDTDPANVADARTHLQSLGLYGPVAVDRLAGGVLPYADDVVNLLVAEQLGEVPMSEVTRVLVPNGVAYVKAGGAWQRTVKPRPTEIDQWTHYLHSPDNNAVADDSVVGPPRRLRWQCGPKWTRHHDKMSSFSAMVSSGGRIFYVIDEGSTASIYMPSHWALIARDAFNGKQLWKRKIDTWFSRFKGLKDGPADAPRRLVAADGRVYATLDLHGPIACLDARTGQTTRRYENTEGAEEILLADGVLFVLVGPGSIGDGSRASRPAEKRTIMAVDSESGRKLWEHSGVVAALTMAVDDQRLYYFDFDDREAVGLDRKTGSPLWTSADALPTPQAQRSFFASKLVVADGVVLLASGEYSGMIKSTGGATENDTLTALSAKTGETMWTAEHPPSGYSSPEDMFVIDGMVWCGTTSNGIQDGTHIGFDLKTGEVKHRFPADKENYWFHHRCYSARATCNYILTSRTGIELVDFRKQQWDLNHWVRGACLYGIMPANGLVYTPPAPCICYAETMLHSFNALAPAARSPVAILPDGKRLEKGPAYGRPVSGRTTPADWPTYRGSISRAGATSGNVPAALETAWEVRVGGRPSAVTAADDKVFVAAVDRHTVHALSALDGSERWHYTAGGRVDSPPTFFEGRLLFGSADGFVYCLRAADGGLVWRFQAAPADRRILVYEQIESLWPVHGSVLVREGVACFVAGRSAFVDGGMCLYRVDVETGEMISKTPVNEQNPNTGNNVQDTVKWLNMAVGRPDVLASDGDRLYMRSQAFDLTGKRLAMGPEAAGAEEGARQGGETTHLFCPTGFLDDTWFHRTYWLYAQTWSSGWCGYHVAGKFAPAGKIMAVGEDRVYAFGREPQYYRWTVPMEYRLFAANKYWKPAPKADDGGGARPARAPKKKRRGAGANTPVANVENYAWSTRVPILVRAMTLAGEILFIAGPRDVLDESELDRAFAGGSDERILAQEAALEGRAGGLLWAVSAVDGERLAEIRLRSPPIFDGMAAANGRLYMATVDGKVLCLGSP